MNKAVWKKLQMGLVSLSAAGLLAACGTNDMDDTPVDDEPAIEEPVDGEEDTGTEGTEVDETEEDEN